MATQFGHTSKYLVGHGGIMQCSKSKKLGPMVMIGWWWAKDYAKYLPIISKYLLSKSKSWT
jgi:hypothetical protein